MPKLGSISGNTIFEKYCAKSMQWEELPVSAGLLLVRHNSKYKNT